MSYLLSHTVVNKKKKKKRKEKKNNRNKLSRSVANGNQYMSLHADTLFWFRANQSLFLLLSAACFAEKQQLLIS